MRMARIKQLTVCKVFTFDAAHRLHNHSWHLPMNKEVFGKCNDLHGHTYRLEVEVAEDVLADLPPLMLQKREESGMVVNFSDLSAVVKERVLEVVDHKYINDILHIDTPTAEILLAWIHNQLDANLPPGIVLKRMRLWETPTAFAEVLYE